jgi:hypothetical protein
MRALLSLSPLVAALLAAAGCVSAPSAPSARPISTSPIPSSQAVTPPALEPCTPQASPSAFSSATSSAAQPGSSISDGSGSGGSGSTASAAARRALIDKRLNDLRRSSGGQQSLQPAVLKSHEAAAPTIANRGNGASAREMPVRSGDDVVARRLRRAAEQETNAGLREKLWREYADYRKNTQGK